MKTFRFHPSPLLPICVGLAFAAIASPSRAGAEAPARALDWSQAAPGRSLPQTAQPGAEGIPAPRMAEKKTAVRPGATPAAKGLFALDDRAIIIVGGKNTTAGAVKRALQAEISAKAGAPKTVKGGARKLDLAALLGSGHSGPKPAPSGQAGLLPPGAPKPTTSTPATASAQQSAQVLRPGVTQSVSASKEAVSLAMLRCPDKGPPKMTESPGKLKAGGTATVWGQCFGDRSGKVEVIGQFPGGKLTLPFTAWDNNSIELSIPPVRGAADHVVAVTVVTADGKTSTAMQAQFVAARERVEVPDRLWSPGAGFEFAATSSTRQLIDPEEVNEAHAGQAAKTLRVQPQCALDTMDATVLSGGITEIRGWEQGPPNEAAVTIDWVGTCINTKTSTHYDYIVVEDSSAIVTRSACRVAFTTRAWAYCPAGIAP